MLQLFSLADEKKCYSSIRYRFACVMFQTEILRMCAKMKHERLFLIIFCPCIKVSHRFLQECPTIKRKQSCCILCSIYFFMNWGILSCIPCSTFYDPAIWPGHIVLPCSVLPPFCHSVIISFIILVTVAHIQLKFDIWICYEKIQVKFEFGHGSIFWQSYAPFTLIIIWNFQFPFIIPPTVLHIQLKLDI
jgi:hypothetical protein